MSKRIWILVALGLAAGASASIYVASRMRVAPEARLRLAPSREAPSSSGGALSGEPKATERRLNSAAPDPIDTDHQELNGAILRDLEASFPQLAKFLDGQSGESNDPAYRQMAFQILDAAEKQRSEKRAVYWLAADRVAQGIWCAMEELIVCDQLRGELGRYHLTLSGEGLGGVFVYSHDLLWRVWEDFPKTAWGERAFVLLLEHGWDTSPTCANGSEQFREVIRRGEQFLADRPTSAQRETVMLLVAEAYAAWWSLSKQPRSGMSDYGNPKQYQAGAEEAREKAIRYFDRIAEAGAEKKAKEYAGKVATILRNREPLIDYKFYCVYD